MNSRQRILEFLSGRRWAEGLTHIVPHNHQHILTTCGAVLFQFY